VEPPGLRRAHLLLVRVSYVPRSKGPGDDYIGAPKHSRLAAGFDGLVMTCH
jgi:hypothetical protein